MRVPSSFEVFGLLAFGLCAGLTRNTNVKTSLSSSSPLSCFGLEKENVFLFRFVLEFFILLQKGEYEIFDFVWRKN